MLTLMATEKVVIFLYILKKMSSISIAQLQILYKSNYISYAVYSTIYNLSRDSTRIDKQQFSIK